MRRYETIVILDSDLSEEERTPIFERVTGLFPQYNGFLVGIDEWGVKKLAYEIKKKPRGFYTLIDFCGHGDLIGEMERFFRIDDRILKFMTVLIEENADIESIKEEIAEKEKKAAEAAAARAEKEVPVETPAEAPTETPVETPAETPAETVAENPDAEPSAEPEVESETRKETIEEE